jgi:hypothetical protein
MSDDCLILKTFLQQADSNTTTITRHCVIFIDKLRHWPNFLPPIT